MADDNIVITQVPNLTDVNVDVSTPASSIKDNLSKVASSMTTTVKETVLMYQVVNHLALICGR